MKKFSVIFLAVLTMATVACKKKTESEIPSPETGGAGSNTVVLSGNLATQTLDASKKYLLKGQVFVLDGKKLTIPAGTVLMGDKATKAALIVKPGGMIFANGTASNPIVFTSALPAGARDEGDWCGVILLGNGVTNWAAAPTIEGITPAVTYGGNVAADNSGTMTYCRIEFAGIALSPNNETNGLTFGGVGSGTTIDYIQVSFGGDDSFEWFGGAVNCTHLVSYATWDDDFDTDNGFSGNIQFGVAVRDAFQADNSGSNGFESDNDAAGSTQTPKTSAVFANMTLLGPVGDTTKPVSNNHQSGAHIRRNTNISIYNSVLAGFKEGMRFDNGGAAPVSANYAISTGSATAFVKNNIMLNAIFAKTAATTGGTSTTYLGNGGSSVVLADLVTLWNANNIPNNLTLSGSTTNTVSPNKAANYPAALTALGIDPALFIAVTPAYPSNPNFAVTSGTLTTASLATLPGAFESASYVGAFGTTDWTDGWAEFDPKNTAY